MDVSRILLDLLIVLVAAKFAAEASERIGVPAVVGEIIAGMIIGPSVLHMVGREDEVLRVLGEIGVILLLLDVGLEMDIGELRKVGRASLSVASIGVVAPMLFGYGAMSAMGETTNTALFVGAALTATSVGITARVFGDLRALATSEARIVLGAAVADDVMGLVVLTVVVRLVTEGSVSLLSVLAIIGVALLFLIVGGVVGLRFTPPLFRFINRIARSNGTLVALAFAFALGFAELAGQAKLAPIVGAFLAGLALSRTDSSERIRSELAPVGHVFIPVFFLGIGIDADIGAFGQLSVLRDAALLLVVAVVGKLIAAVGARGAPGDKVLIGLGMLPRGEVGLIFATIGLANGVLSEELYAALLLVVLSTTLMAPPLLKIRSRVVLQRTRDAVRARGGDEVPPIPLVIDREVHLPGVVAGEDALELALRAAVFARSAAPSGDLVAWLGGVEEGLATGWSAEERELLFDVIERGNARSWRFLEATGTLDRAMPELERAVRRRRSDLLDLDTDAAYRWRALERLRALDASDPLIEEARGLDHPKRLLVAALLVEAFDAEADPVGAARALVDRIGMESADRIEVAALVEDRHLLWAAARRTGAFDEDNVRQVAGHLVHPERARATYVLAALRSDGHEGWERVRLAQLHDLVQDTLAREAPDGETRDLVVQRRAMLARMVGDDDRVVARALAAPPAFVLALPLEQAAEHLRSIDPLPARRHLRVSVGDVLVPGQWVIAVTSRDRAGMLAAMAAALSAKGYNIMRADVATWADGAALEIFLVAGDGRSGAGRPSADALSDALHAALTEPTAAGPIADIEFTFDDRASPWHTVCEIEAEERSGLLGAVAAVFRAAGVTIRSASVVSRNGRAYDVFELTNANGRKLEPETERQIRALAAVGLAVQRRRFRAPVLVANSV